MPLPRLALTPDLELELPSLVGSSEPQLGAAIRVTVNPAGWPGAPHTVMAPGRVIAVDPAGPGSDAHVITLACGTVRRWVLLVVPPGEPAGTAARLPADAGPENPLSAARMLMLAETGRPVGATGEAE
ncbi:DUF5994 family protein [Streptomyces filipinensis]|nr:DUF5994 family protein [Streptomyces filipinensis]